MKFNSIALKSAALSSAQHSVLSLGLLSALLIKIVSNIAKMDSSLVRMRCLNWVLHLVLNSSLVDLSKEILKSYFFLALSSVFILYP